MGMERAIAVQGMGPGWPRIRTALAAKGFNAQMRMIDNMPAFPDEDPDENWQDIRITLGHGMITVRRSENLFRVIIWGNADAALQQDQEALATTIAELTATLT